MGQPASSMKSFGQRAAESPIGGGRLPIPVNLAVRARYVLLIAGLSGGLFWLVWIYGNGLRDPRYLDGWVLAAGMGLQLYFHAATKTSSLSPKALLRWRKLHIFMGYLLIAVFVSHSDFTLPDTHFEWAIWIGFVLVAVSGLFGTYLAWSREAKRGSDERFGDDRIETRRAELADEVQAAVDAADPDPAAALLPSPPYHAWIADLYTNHLESFFRGSGDAVAHLVGSRRTVQRLTDEIDNLSRYVDKQSQAKLDTIKSLIFEKDRLDAAHVHNGLTKGWLLIHVPVTYALVVLTIFHIVVVYAFSSGAW